MAELNGGRSVNASKKDAVRAFWDEASCGERLYLPDTTASGFRQHDSERYRLEPYIETFAQFESAKGLRVLEIGIGLGADHQRFAEAGAELVGIDLTPRAIDRTRERFYALGLTSELKVGDAEKLDFESNCFDVVYSWGVVHHSPDTRAAVNEIYRVLKPGGVAKVMVYNKYSLVGLMLWLRYALAAGRPLTSLASIYSTYLESPGTKAYTESEARDLFARFEQVSVSVVLSHGDLLTSQAGQRHGGLALEAARLIWPRWLLRRICRRNGLFMLIDATKAR
jgi:ubiquinone/menaquinone biosynthesis C-methylase UbiE